MQELSEYGLDMDKALDLMDGEVEVLIEMVDIFIKDRAPKGDKMMNALNNGDMENYAILEMLRNASYGEKTMNLNFYRDTNQKEIDLVVESDGVLHPFEIKRTASPDKKLIRTFSVLEKTERSIGAGGILCMAERPFPVDERNSLVPVNLLYPVIE